MIREAELEAAAEIIGVRRTSLFDCRDGALTDVPLPELVAHVTAMAPAPALTVTGCCPTTSSTPEPGLWRHRAATIIAQQIPDLRAIAAGVPDPIGVQRIGEPALAAQLDEAERLLTGRPDVTGDGPTGLPPAF